jgi:hypothetical protein
MSEPDLESLMKMFSFEKKADLVRYCRDLTIRSEDFFTLLLGCEASGEPFIHEISYRDKVPLHLVPKDSEIEALKSTPAGTLLSGYAAKAVSKMAHAFDERRYLVGHLFFKPDYSQWHFFCFDQRDIAAEGNHWKEGSHVHFVSWLWPGLDPKSILSDFVTEEERPGGAIHLRFIGRQEDKRIRIKKCEFTEPVEKRSSTGLHKGMFNEDVAFRFEVEIEGTDRKHIEEMLNLFDRAAAGFKETWQKKLQSLH